MKYKDATELMPKFSNLNGRSFEEITIKYIFVSYTEKTLAEERHSAYLTGMPHKLFSDGYKEDFTLWALLDNNTILRVKRIILAYSVQDLMKDILLLD